MQGNVRKKLPKHWVADNVSPHGIGDNSFEEKTPGTRTDGPTSTFVSIAPMHSPDKRQRLFFCCLFRLLF
jgi:hypothetical protein